MKIDIQNNGALFELGAFTGRRQAFAALAGTCSAADAECLRRIREKKMYKALRLSWEEFCRERAGVSRVTADRLIRRLEEFGPAYFQLAQVTGITEPDYRRIAGSVRDGGLAFEGELIPIGPEHAPRLTAAVSELRRQAAPAKAKQLRRVIASAESAPQPRDPAAEPAMPRTEAEIVTAAAPEGIDPTRESEAATVALQPEAGDLPREIHAAASQPRLPDTAATLNQRISDVEQALQTAIDQLETLRPFALHFTVRDRLTSRLNEGLRKTYEIKELPRIC